MAIQWTEGMWNTHTCKLGVFTVRVQREDSGKWKSDVIYLTAKARWNTLDEAKAGAVIVWTKMFAEAATAGGT